MQNYDIGILVCNAGLGGYGPINFNTDSQVGSMCSVNIVHPTFLTKVFLEHFKNRRKKSCVINVSSLMELHPTAGLSLYSSSKAYVHHWSSALAVELSRDEKLQPKVDVCTISPSFVSTKLNGMRSIPLLIPSPLSAARSYL